MHINFRTVFLKSVPYLMSIAGGIVLYTGAIDNAPNADVRDLVINVSASLLSIPLVFLLYDYTNSRIARRVNQNLSATMSARLNSMIFHLIILLRRMMAVRTRLNLENLNRMLIWRAPTIGSRLKISRTNLDELRKIHTELDGILFSADVAAILSTTQIQILTALSRDILHLINENKFRGNRHISARYIEGIMSRLTDWLDSDAVAALHLEQNISTLNPIDKSKN